MRWEVILEIFVLSLHVTYTLFLYRDRRKEDKNKNPEVFINRVNAQYGTVNINQPHILTFDIWHEQLYTQSVPVSPQRIDALFFKMTSN